MNIITLKLGDYQTNCYIVFEEGANRAVLIDPGYEPERISDTLQRHGLMPDMVLLTHGHFDHVGATQALHGATGCKVYIHKEDLMLPKDLCDGLYHTDTYAEGDVITSGALRFTVLETPGHTPGSVTLRCGNSLFCGDTLFRGSCGRTDLAGGNWSQIAQSLYRLGMIKEDCAVYPGHGESSTLEAERQSNPFLRCVMGKRT